MAAVTLDLWHTLIYLPPEAEEVYMQRQIDYGTRVLKRAPPARAGPSIPNRELRAAFERAYSEAVDASTHGRTITPTAQIVRAGELSGRDPDPARYLAALRREVATTPFRRAPGALRLLRELRREGYRVAVISNTVGEPGAYLRPVLHSFRLDRDVETFVFSDEQPWTKPSPSIFRYALRQLGSAPFEAVHVGDGWADIEGARRARFRGAVLFTGLHAYGARYQELFLPEVPRIPKGTRSARRLVDVGRIVRELLPAVPPAP